jgi:hypothetical protein
MRESLSHGFLTNWQISKTHTRSRKDRVPNRRGNSGSRGLAQSNWHFCAGNKFDFEFRDVQCAESLHPA